MRFLSGRATIGYTIIDFTRQPISPGLVMSTPEDVSYNCNIINISVTNIEHGTLNKDNPLHPSASLLQ